jgi:putative membrane protein
MICAASVLALAACGERADLDTNEAVVADGGVVGAETPAGETLGDPATPATIGTENNAIPEPLSAAAFVRLAKLSNQLEINSSQLALEKSRDAAVRVFAEKMVADHRRVGELMEQIVAADASFQEETGGMDPLASDVVMARLRQAEAGAAFDREYKLAQIQAHEWTIELFEEASDEATVPEPMQAFAEQTLPALRQHLEMARALPAALPVGVQP